MLCQRYYQIAGAGASGKFNAGGTGIGVGIQYKVPMRTTSVTAALTTTTVYAGDAFVAVLSTSSATVLYTSLTSYSAQGGNYGCEMQIGGFSGATANNPGILYTNCVGLNAEL